MKVFLAGGGSGGAVAPVLAVAEAIHEKHKAARFFLVTTKRGREIDLLKTVELPITTLTIPAGKWRRYFSLMNLVDMFRVLAGLAKSLFLLKKYKPDVVFGAGSFVQVPLVWAAYLSGVPAVVHQQDLDELLSTKLAAPVARSVTLSFATTAQFLPESSGLLKKTSKSKYMVTGNPVRKDVLLGSKDRARELFQLNSKYPTVLVMGGSQGAESLNKIVLEALSELTKYVQILHITGVAHQKKDKERIVNYAARPFLKEELKDAYAAADLVIARAGMSTLTELSRLGKPAILVPLPKSPQEDNARLADYFKCAIMIAQDFLTPQILVKMVRKILWDSSLQRELSSRIKRLMPADAAANIANVVLNAAKK